MSFLTDMITKISREKYITKMDNDPLAYIENSFNDKKAQSSPKHPPFDFRKNCFQQAFCIGGNKCVYVCIEQKCEKNGVICSDLKCKCRSSHEVNGQVCMLADPSVIMRKMSQKVYNMPKAILELDHIVQNFIDLLSEVRDELTLKIQIQEYNFDDKEIELIKMIEKGEFKKLNGVILAEVLQKNRTNENSLSERKQSETKIIEGWRQKHKQMRQIIQSFSINSCFAKRQGGAKRAFKQKKIKALKISQNENLLYDWL